MLSRISLVKQSAKAKVILKIWQRKYGLIVDHYSITVDQPRHSKCPKGKNSSYQRDIQLVKEHINLQSGRLPKELLMYFTRYLFGLQMKVSWKKIENTAKQVRLNTMGTFRNFS